MVNAYTVEKQTLPEGRRVDEGEVRVLKITALVYGVIGLPCLICGTVTLVYAAVDLKWPVSSGFGGVEGVMALAICILGLLAFMRFNYEIPAANRCKVYGFYGCVCSNISLVTMHLAWSITGLLECNDGKGEYSFCQTWEKDRFLLVEGFNIGCASLLLLLNIWTMGYILSARRLQRMTAVYSCCGYNHC